MPNPNTDFSSGAVLTAAQQNRFPRGVMALTTSTSNVIAFGVLAGLSTTFTAVANRLYKVSLHIVTSSATPTSRIIVGFTGNSTRPIDYTVAITNLNSITGFGVQTYAAGAQTINVQWSLISGSVSPAAAAGNPHQLVIEDLGPS